MDYNLNSEDDLLKIYAPHTATHALQIVPTLIYSGSWNGTFQIMKVINEAWKAKLHEYNPTDILIRRFHLCTGILNMEDFSNELFP
jgi:hypothetical protein